MQDLDVTVVLPVYNEKGHLRDEIERISVALEASVYSWEIIVVDDGSDDGSGAQIDEVARQHDAIRVIRFGSNRGVGAARKAGTASARGRVVVWTDVDMTYPNDEIPRLVKELEGHDQVVGARTSQGTFRPGRKQAQWLIQKLAEYLSETKIPDLNSGLRAFRTDVVLQFLHLFPARMSHVTTVTMAFLANGYSVKYVPIDYFERAGKSKFHWYRDTQRYALQVVRMLLSYNPLRIFLPVGMLLGLVGVAKLGYDWATDEFQLAINTLLVLFASLQVLAIGLLADLVVRVTKPEHEVPPAEYSSSE
ncbi:MAG TPA: glycosyltransferase family 2 protein [Acidimicrobiales bacterium]|nr:glycosyltransferase family 2 protein [Acidimicrobiales bacterium]